MYGFEGDDVMEFRSAYVFVIIVYSSTPSMLIMKNRRKLTIPVNMTRLFPTNLYYQLSFSRYAWK